MITMQENLGVDAARSALAFNNVVEINSRINWDFWGPALILVLAVGIVLFQNRGSIVWWLKNNWFTRWRERRDMRAEREKKLREILSDNIQDAVDEAWLDKDITDEERQWAFEAIGKLGFPDLRTKGQTLKDEIKAKRAKEVPAEETSMRTVHVL